MCEKQKGRAWVQVSAILATFSVWPGPLRQPGEYLVCPADGGRDPGYRRESKPDSERTAPQLSQEEVRWKWRCVCGVRWRGGRRRGWEEMYGRAWVGGGAMAKGGK